MGDEASSHWSSAIPEIFYDLIARVLPGAVAAGAAAGQYLSFRLWIERRPGTIGWSTTGTGAVVLCLCVVAACWVVGLLTTPLGDAIWRGPRSEEIFLKISWQHRDLLRRAAERGIVDHARGPDLWVAESEDVLREGLKGLSGTTYQQLHEYLKDRRDVWRGVLTKVQAEVTFYANVATTMKLLMFATIPLVLCGCFVMNIGIGSVSIRNWTGFVLTGVAPVALLRWSAYRGLISKHPRMWARHIACLTVDMKSGETLPSTFAGGTIEPARNLERIAD